MPDVGLRLLSAMITPAVLISACGTLIFSTSTRLARIVDRVRSLTRDLEPEHDGRRDPEEWRRHFDLQLGMYADRATLVQGALTAFYRALGLFVGSTITIGLTVFLPGSEFVPTLLGVLGTLELFRGSVRLIREARISLRSVEAEMAYALRLRGAAPSTSSASPAESPRAD